MCWTTLPFLATITYDAWGNETASGAVGSYGWTGREFDSGTGLQHNGWREYDPKTSRWLSQDPLGFDAGDSNLYRYVKNQQTVAVDPYGLDYIKYDWSSPSPDGKVFPAYWVIQSRPPTTRPDRYVPIGVASAAFAGELTIYTLEQFGSRAVKDSVLGSWLVLGDGTLGGTAALALGSETQDTQAFFISSAIEQASQGKSADPKTTERFGRKWEMMWGAPSFNFVTAMGLGFLQSKPKASSSEPASGATRPTTTAKNSARQDWRVKYLLDMTPKSPLGPSKEVLEGYNGNVRLAETFSQFGFINEDQVVKYLTNQSEEQAKVVNRYFGALRLIGSAAETVGGILAAPVGGGILAVHGVDGMIASTLQIATGEQTRTFTSSLIGGGASLVTDESTAYNIGEIGDALVPLAAGAYTSYRLYRLPIASPGPIAAPTTSGAGRYVPNPIMEQIGTGYGMAAEAPFSGPTAVSRLQGYYGPFWRSESPAAVASIQQSGTILGHRPTGYNYSNIPTVQAYPYNLPQGAMGLEFYTPLPYELVPQFGGLQAWWRGVPNTDVHSIPVVITRTGS